MNKLIIRGEPVGPFQYVYANEDGKKVESIGIQIENLEDVVFALLKNYNINHIDLSGSRLYMEGIERMLKNAQINDYEKTELIFKYV